MEQPVDYSSYLQVPRLLSLQGPRQAESSDRPTLLAEHFFIICHQVCELWLKQMLADLDLAADLLGPRFDDDQGLERSTELIERAGTLMRLMHAQLVALECLDVEDFARFRPLLGEASGAQSAQFGQLDITLGAHGQDSRIQRQLGEWCHRHRVDLARACSQSERMFPVTRLVDSLLDLGNGLWRWKITHVAVVSRMLGGRPGTGGSSGDRYLSERATLPFGELRQLRNAVIDSQAG